MFVILLENNAKYSWYVALCLGVVDGLSTNRSPTDVTAVLNTIKGDTATDR